MRRRRLASNRVLAVVAALLALNAILFVTQPGLALPRPLLSRYFGPKMVRAEVVLKEQGVVRLDRIDRGQIRTMTGESLTLRERDGRTVTIEIAPNARVSVNGRLAGVAALRRGMQATVISEGDDSADVIQAAWRR